MADSRVVAPLQGDYIERLDRPLPGLYAISMVSEGARRVLLLAAGPPRLTPAWALAPSRPRGEAADPHVRGLREKLEGARLLSFTSSRTGWALVAERGEYRWRLEGHHRGVTCGVALPEQAAPSPERSDAAGALPSLSPERSDAPGAVPSPERPDAAGAVPSPERPDAAGAVPSPERPDAAGAVLAPERLADAWRRGETFVDEHRRHELAWARDAALAALRRVRARLERRIAAVEADLAAIEAAHERGQRAAPFAAVVARAPRGATKLEAIDWSTGEAHTITLELDPARPAREQLDALFARARRLRAGAPLAEKRRDEATLALWRLDEVGPALERAESVAAVEALLEALARELPRDLPLRPPPPPAPRSRLRSGPTREPFRRYEGEGQAAILVGRDAASNDELTVRVARPGDLWLHAKDGTGSHVVVPGACKKGPPDAGVLVDAATLAAHFSELRGEAVVDVLYADRRHVRKRKGSPRGAVEVPRSKTLALRVEPERLARLLATYRPTP